MKAQEPENIASEAAQRISPALCRPWRFHNRSKSWLNSEEQRRLEQSIEKDDQQQPGLVRTTKGDSDFRYEIIFGFRRCSACGSTEKLFVAKVLPADTSDQVCARLMHIENEQRANVSELERARNYRALIEGGVFSEHTELAAELRVSASRVSQMLKAAEVFDYPWLSDLIEPGLMDVSIRSATQMARALNNTERQRLMRDRAHRLIEQGGDVDASEVVKRLLADTGVNKVAPQKREVLARVGRQSVAEISRTKGGGMQVSVEKVDRSPEETDELIDQIVGRIREFLSDEASVSVT